MGSLVPLGMFLWLGGDESIVNEGEADAGLW